MYYHVLVLTKETGEITELDHTNLEKIEQEVIKPYLLNESFQIDGYFIEPSQVKRLVITKTEKKSSVLQDMEYDNLSKNIITIISKSDCVFKYEKYKTDITKEVLKKIKGKIEIKDTQKSENKKTIFLAYSYREDDEEFVNGFKEFIKDKGYKIIDGKADRFGSVSQAIIDKIDISDLVLIVMNKRDKKENGKFTTSSWLLEEKGAAIAFGKDVIMFVEEGIDDSDIGGIQGDDQMFYFTKNNFMSKAMNFIRILESRDDR